MTLEKSLLDSIWRRHEHCGDCGSRKEGLDREIFCTATRGTDCPWFQQELSSYIEETFAPDEWEFLSRYNSEDAEGLFLMAYKIEFSYSPAVAQTMLNYYHQAKALKEQT